MVPLAAKSNTLTPDQIAVYNGSLEQIRDIQLAIDYKAEEAARKAARETAEEVARNLMQMGLSDKDIHKATALPLSHIVALRASL